MRALLALPLLSLAACGGLNNEPLRTGVVQGTVASADPGWQAVTDLGSGQTATFDSGGVFTLSGVAPGTANLYVVANVHGATRVQAPVSGGLLTQLGVVQPQPAGKVNVHLKAMGVPNPNASMVSIDDTPFANQTFDNTNTAHIGPLTDGCYTGSVKHPTAGSAPLSFCMANGQDTDTTATLP